MAGESKKSQQKPETIRLRLRLVQEMRDLILTATSDLGFGVANDIPP